MRRAIRCNFFASARSQRDALELLSPILAQNADCENDICPAAGALQ
jgi:hypothetical protein